MPVNPKMAAALLDLLCEHEESVIECHTLSNGECGPGRTACDVIAYLAQARSRRIWRRAQSVMIELEADHA